MAWEKLLPDFHEDEEEENTTSFKNMLYFKVANAPPPVFLRLTLASMDPSE